MITTKYDFPLPNDENRYNLSKEEFTKILECVFDRGYEYARNIYDPERKSTTTYASTTRKGEISNK